MSTVIVKQVDGSELSAKILPIDRVMFERHFGKGVGSIAAEQKEEHLLWIAHHALRRQGATALDFDAWLISVEDYDSEDDALPPLDQAVSPTP